MTGDRTPPILLKDQGSGRNRHILLSWNRPRTSASPASRPRPGICPAGRTQRGRRWSSRCATTPG